jgi:hypothetical protein
VSPPPEEDFYLRIDRSDDLFKCAHCFELLSSPVYEVTHYNPCPSVSFSIDVRMQSSLTDRVCDSIHRRGYDLAITLKHISHTWKQQSKTTRII